MNPHCQAHHVNAPMHAVSAEQDSDQPRKEPSTKLITFMCVGDEKTVLANNSYPTHYLLERN